MSDLNLTESFPDYDKTDWQALVEKGLKGAGFETLIRQTDDGLTRGPLSTADDRPEDIAALPRAGTPLLAGRPWHICAPVRDPELAHANKQLLEDLEGGASAARIMLGEHGVAVKSANDLKRLLDRVYTDLIPITIAPSQDLGVAKLFAEYKDAAICLGLDPKTEGLESLAKSLPQSWRLITINAARVNDVGGTEAQELAYFAANAAHAYRVLGAEAAKHMGVELTTDQDGHLSIAKLRAARRIYARIAEIFGVSEAPLSIHVVTSKRMMQSTDPWTNMLRVMSACFGAVTGGGDFITARPFTDAIGHATGFGHRIARNMQLMMMEETHLGQVIDPAFGSYFHERMTDELAHAAWEKFQLIEAAGGIVDYLKAGDFRMALDAAIATREAGEPPILGVTLHKAESMRQAKVRGARS